MAIDASADAAATSAAGGGRGRVGGAVLLHGALGAALALAWLGAEAHPGSHAWLGLVSIGAFGLWLATTGVLGLARAASRSPRPIWQTGRTALRWAMAAAVLLIASSGLLLGDVTWGDRSIVGDVHEAMAAILPWMLALHAVGELGVRWRERRA